MCINIRNYFINIRNNFIVIEIFLLFNIMISKIFLKPKHNRNMSDFLKIHSNNNFKILAKNYNTNNFIKYSYKSFSNSNKEELKNLKASLNQEKNSFLEKVTNYFGFNKTQIVNHTNRDLNLEEIRNEMNKMQKDEEKKILENKKDDEKKLEEFFQIQKKFISKQALDESYVDKAIEILRSLKSIENLFRDKKYNMFKDDLIFLTNSCNNPKILSKIINFSFIFMKEEENGKTFSEFCENLAERTKFMLEETELNELLILVNFFCSLKNLNSIYIQNLYEPFKNEIFRRLDKEFYLKSRMQNPFIENDEIVKILLIYNEGKLLDESLVNKIIQNVFENVENFSIKDILEISLFFLEKNEFSIIFQNFFNRMNVIKLKRNIKNMNLESLYDYSFLYKKLDRFKSEENVLNSILDTLLKSSSDKKEMESFLLFEKTSPKTVTKFVRIFENELATDKKNFYSFLSEYFVKNFKKFEIEDSFYLINLLKSKRSLDEEILKKVLNNFYSNMNTHDDKNIIKLCNFYLANPSLEFSPRLVSEFEKIFRNSSNLNLCAEILFLFVRREQNLNLAKEREKAEVQEFIFLTEENLSIFLNKYETIKNLTPELKNSKNTLETKNKIKILLSLSYFYIPPLFFKIKDQNLFENNVVDHIIQEIIITKPKFLESLTLYEVLILIHSCRNFTKSKAKKFDPIFLEKICELLKSVDNLVIKHMRAFTLIEFLAVFDIYTSKKIASHSLIEAFSELILSSIEQFSLIHLDILIKGMEDVISYVTKDEKEKLKEENLEKNPFDIVKILKMLKIRLETRVLEKSTEEVSEEMMREVVKDFLKKEKEKVSHLGSQKANFKKLI